MQLFQLKLDMARLKGGQRWDRYCIPVVLHKAVAEVSRIGNVYSRRE